MKKITRILMASVLPQLLFFLLMGAALGKAFNTGPVGTTVTCVTISLVSALLPQRVSQFTVFTNAIQKEMWVDYIIQRFWKDNTFLQNCWSDDKYVLAGKVVHIPNPGAAPVVTVNRSVFPAAAVRRTDTDITFSLNEYTTAPSHIENAEMIEASYDKIDSIIGEHIGVLNDAVGDNCLLAWADESVSAPPIKTFTTGLSASVGTDSIATALTGNRLSMVNADVRKMKLAFDLQKVPKTERYCVLEANMADQLLNDLSVTQYRDFSAAADIKNGIVGQLYGFTVLTRDCTLTYNAANALNAYGAVSAATDKYASLFWHRNSVTRAMGEVKLFDSVDRPEYYGDLYSALIRFGGRRRRSDNFGLGVLIAA